MKIKKKNLAGVRGVRWGVGLVGWVGGLGWM